MLGSPCSPCCAGCNAESLCAQLWQQSVSVTLAASGYETQDDAWRVSEWSRRTLGSTPQFYLGNVDPGVNFDLLREQSKQDFANAVPTLELWKAEPVLGGTYQLYPNMSAYAAGQCATFGYSDDDNIITLSLFVSAADVESQQWPDTRCAVRATLQIRRRRRWWSGSIVDYGINPTTNATCFTTLDNSGNYFAYRPATNLTESAPAAVTHLSFIEYLTEVGAFSGAAVGRRSTSLGCTSADPTWSFDTRFVYEQFNALLTPVQQAGGVVLAQLAPHQSVRNTYKFVAATAGYPLYGSVAISPPSQPATNVFSVTGTLSDTSFVERDVPYTTTASLTIA